LLALAPALREGLAKEDGGSSAAFAVDWLQSGVRAFEQGAFCIPTLSRSTCITLIAMGGVCQTVRSYFCLN